MSSGGSGDALSPIIQQGIDQLAATNQQANEELSELLQQQRDQLQLGWDPVPPATSPPVGTGQDDEYIRRLQLYSSQWNSEVVAAAVLSEDFQTEVGEKAKQILREHGRLPDIPDEPVETPTS